MENPSVQPAASSAVMRLPKRLSYQRLISILKWIVYPLLILNFFYYLSDDLQTVQHTLDADSSLRKWFNALAPSFDQLAWVLLILVYEIETYWLDDDYDNRLVEGAMLLAKLTFVAFICNTIYTYAFYVSEIPGMLPIEGVRDLCALAGQDLSFYRNVTYTEITAQTCSTIPYSGTLYSYPSDPLVTDAAGRLEDAQLRVIDLIEGIVWLLILGLTELSVRLQERGIYKGALLSVDRRGKQLLYSLLILACIYWGVKGHFVYVWDEALWILSFLVLDNNLSIWRDDLADQDDQADASGALHTEHGS